MTLARTRKPRNQRSKRVLKTRESKLTENAKTAIIVKGQTTSKVICDVMNDIALMKKPHVKKLTRKNDTHPFEDQNTIEFLSRMNDASLLAFGSHSKKRPHNLVLGRFFDHQMLDLFEFGLDPQTIVTLEEFSVIRSVGVHLGSKPMFYFAGDEFEINPELIRFKNFIVDFFHGENVEKLNLAGLDRVIVCIAKGPKTILFSQFAVTLKKSGTKIPKVKLEEMGPRLDLTLRRTTQASDNIVNESLKKPKLAKSNTQRGNVEKGALGQTLGRVHVQQQELGELALRKMKGLKADRQVSVANRSGASSEVESNDGQSESANDEELEDSEMDNTDNSDDDEDHDSSIEEAD